MQQRLLFYDNTLDRAFPNLPLRPTDEEINLALAPNNANCPLNEILVSPENEGNIRMLRRLAFTALQRVDRSLKGCSFGLYCPPGQGKTFIVKRFAETVGIPFVFVQSPSLEDTWHLFQMIEKECEKAGVPLQEDRRNPKADYILPPMIVFFDEAHYLKDSLQKGSLLNPMEPDDGYMHVKKPGMKGETIVVDCHDVCWIGATTERGELFDAFESRLLNPIEWISAGSKELPLIIESGLKAKAKKGLLPFAPPPDVCKMIARFSKVPRLAIHGFGSQVVQQKNMFSSFTWEECCKVVAKDLGINDQGFDRKQVAILAALGQRPIAEARLQEVAKCRLEQVRRYVLPGLMQYGDGGPYIVSVSGKGMAITRSGQKMLERMSITHKGEKITAEYFEAKR